MQVGGVGDDDAGFALDGLDEEGCDFGAVSFERGAQGGDVVVWEGLFGFGACGADVGEVGPVVVAGLGVRGHGDCGEGAAVEVLRDAEDEGLVLGDALHFVAPFPGDLDGGFDGLGAGVHGEDHVEVEIAGYEFGEAGKDIVVEGSRAEGQSRCLLSQGFDEFGVAVALVDCAVSAQKV